MWQFNSGREEEVYALYHSYWLHTGQQVEVRLGGPREISPFGRREIKLSNFYQKNEQMSNNFLERNSNANYLIIEK